VKSWENIIAPPVMSPPMRLELWRSIISGDANLNEDLKISLDATMP